MSVPTSTSPLFVSAGAGTVLEVGDQHGIVAISAQVTGNVFSLIVLDTDPGAHVPPHVHLHEDETFYVVAGRYSIQVDGQTWEAGPGDTLHAPRQIVHTWTCISEMPGRLALFITPGQNFETFFARMSQKMIAAHAGDVASLGAELGALAQQHGMTMMPQDMAPYAPTRSPLYVPAGGGLHTDLGDHQAWLKIGAQHTENTFLLAEAQVDKDGGVPPHIHHREEEMFYVLEGRIEFLLGEQIIEAGPGDTVFAPRDIAHAFRGMSEGGARMLSLITPGDNFQAFCERMAARQSIPSSDMANPATVQEFVALAAQYGIDMLPSIK